MMHGRSERLVVPFILGAAVAIAAAPAEARDWYVGFAHEETHVEVFRGIGWEVGDEESGYSLRGGLRLTDHFAVDFGLGHAADLQWTEYAAEVPGLPGAYVGYSVFDVSALQASAMGIVPFGRIWEFYGKGGAVYSRLSGEQELESWFRGPALSRSVSEDGFDFVIGLGIGVTVAENWHVNVGYEYFEFDESFLAVRAGDAASIDSVTMGFQYRLRGNPKR